jgi:hypothetical protein
MLVFFGWLVRFRFGWEVEVDLRLGTERRPRNLIMGVCLKRTLVARILAVVCGVYVWCCGSSRLVRFGWARKVVVLLGEARDVKPSERFESGVAAQRIVRECGVE